MQQAPERDHCDECGEPLAGGFHLRHSFNASDLAGAAVEIQFCDRCLARLLQVMFPQARWSGPSGAIEAAPGGDVLDDLLARITPENLHSAGALSGDWCSDGQQHWKLDDPAGPIGQVRAAPATELIAALEDSYSLPGRAAGPLSTSLEWEEIKRRLTGVDPLDDEAGDTRASVFTHTGAILHDEALQAFVKGLTTPAPPTQALVDAIRRAKVIRQADPASPEGDEKPKPDDGEHTRGESRQR